MFEGDNDSAEAVEETYNLLRENQHLPAGDYLKFEENYLLKICELSIESLKKDQAVIDLEAPICVVGDIHAQYVYLWKFLNYAGEPPKSKFLFLGDYVDRGINSIEVIALVLCLKLLYPKHVFLIRGNHETPEMTKSYGFLEECEQRFNHDLYEKFLKVFECIPLAAVINKKIFCVHGGLSEDLKIVQQLRNIELPHRIPDSGLTFNILWSDPKKGGNRFETNDSRGGSYTFGHDVTKEFLENNNLLKIFRAHEVVKEGYEYPFEDESVLTLFSSVNYCDTLGNKGAIALLDMGLNIKIHTENPSYFNI